MSKALIVGGAGATGRHLAEGLARRGHEVTILHRGVHEPEYLAPYRHVHADPHFSEPVAAALGTECFDLLVLAYGRVERLARLFEGRCGQLVAVGGLPVTSGFVDPAACLPWGVPLLADETAVPDSAAELAAIALPAARNFVAKMRAAEQAVLAANARGAYRGSVVRYARIYGPRSIAAQEWSIVRRVLDGRGHLLLPNAGQAVFTRCAAENAAHLVLLALDRPEVAAGQIFHSGDTDQYSLVQWVRLVLAALDARLEIVGLPPALNHVAPHFALYGGSMFEHALVSNAKARDLLGYRDVVPAAAAIAASARWWREHGAERIREMIARDAFDYATEDRVLADLAELARRHPAAPRSLPFHSFPHPKEPGLVPDHGGR